ncbi:hypothetical protein ZWY2020_038258 [Hordeum vulgare]|nr:hypothetical protein ZWY2020_038258 [Hordeum vulgare]
MASPVVEAAQATVVEGTKDNKGEVKWLKHYSSAQSILVVGDGDFSFSLALATTFGSGKNLVATSLDSYGYLTTWYSSAGSNVASLKSMGATVLHDVDVREMKSHAHLKLNRFDRIVFNFPHAGFTGNETQQHMIKSHRLLVLAFFRNASHLLRPDGEIHVTHRTGHPYDRWEIQQLASGSALVMSNKESFFKYYYPGYNQKRGSGSRCNEGFPIDGSFTFKFRMERKEDGSAPIPLAAGLDLMKLEAVTSSA